MSDKIGANHLARRAILYVRQSTQQQLQHNEESRRLQYAMKRRLQDLGWEDVEIIDEDLGKSAAGTVERSGFQRLVSEVSLGKIGVVCARELSRLARNSMDWQKLMEVCRYVDTLLVDHDAVYDIRKSNDRLLLGLKGNLNGTSWICCACARSKPEQRKPDAVSITPRSPSAIARRWMAASRSTRMRVYIRRCTSSSTRSSSLAV
jgi:hypothetical protein